MSHKTAASDAAHHAKQQLPDFVTQLNGQQTMPSSKPPTTAPAFTIATLVTDIAQYSEMCASFAAGGFTAETCEFIAIDNTDKAAQTDAYRGLNAALSAATAPYVILCHQDIRLLKDDRSDLLVRLKELNATYPDWAVTGNAGGRAISETATSGSSKTGPLALRISDPHGKNQAVGPFPARVHTLDENLIIVRREARIGFSRDLSGFHFYGADICMAAETMGWQAYVIDFHVRHLSPGNPDHSFHAAKAAFRSKWSTALRPRLLQTTCAIVALTPRTPLQKLAPAFEKILSAIRRRWFARRCARPERHEGRPGRSLPIAPEN